MLDGHGTIDEEGKFIAAHAGDEGLVMGILSDLVGHHGEQFISGGIAQAVVDLLEVVQLDQADGQGTVGGLFALGQPLQPGHEGGPVGQQGQWVIPGQEVLQLHLAGDHEQDEQADGQQGDQYQYVPFLGLLQLLTLLDGGGAGEVHHHQIPDGRQQLVHSAFHLGQPG